MGCDIKDHIAHIKALSDGTWAPPHLLIDHLNGTAERSAVFAGAMGSSAWGRTLGTLHDTGKSSSRWQTYLRHASGFDSEAHLEGKPGKVDHSTPGAQLAEELYGPAIGRLLAYCVAGHHTGLPDWYPGDESGQSALQYRLSTVTTDFIAPSLRHTTAVPEPGTPPWRFDNKGLDLSLWLRMLFSCLVDADFLDTESYMSPEQTELRGTYCSPKQLLDRLNAHIENLVKTAPTSRVNDIRRGVLADCRQAARQTPGLFTLTVPTGGGKTLSSMAFALEHAIRHGQRRVIYVIPYTSIIEQNAKVFRQALGSDQVVEHHSSLDSDESTTQSRLASENWDAPVIVTTTVQFFESLFAAKPGRCRKLHNIAKSVVVLDEAQLLPTDFLEPVLDTMELLTRRYGVSIVMATATQPAFGSRPEFKGLPTGRIREIVRDVSTLYQGLKRVDVQTPVDWRRPASWETLADQLQHERQVLCIVSDRKSCRELFDLLPPSANTFHLSALMCGRHRSDTINEIREKLADDEPVRVISTQLVEAGVDVDFPVVYRALAGLDSLAQAAGRCNREGRLDRKGRVVVFNAPRQAPPGILRKAAQITERMLKSGLSDPLDHNNFDRFFGELYWQANSLDKHGIIDLLTADPYDCAIQFRTAAARFRIIDDSAQETILVPYRDGTEFIELLRKRGPDRWLLRKLQRYTVNVYRYDFMTMKARGTIMEVVPGMYALASALDYDEKTGLKTDENPYDPSALIQ